MADHKAARARFKRIINFREDMSTWQELNGARAYLELLTAAEAYRDDVRAGLTPTPNHPLNKILEPK